MEVFFLHFKFDQKKYFELLQILWYKALKKNSKYQEFKPHQVQKLNSQFDNVKKFFRRISKKII